MNMIVTHNMMAMNAQRQFNIVGDKKKKSVEKLSSGYRINRAADDAAGLAISEKMRRQIRGLTQGTRNTQDGISMCQVADGALSEVDDMLHRITELSVKAANGTNTNEDRQAIQEEINQLLTEIDRVGQTTTFNEKNIFRGSAPVFASAGNIPQYDESIFEPYRYIDSSWELRNGDYYITSGGNVPSLGYQGKIYIDTSEPVIFHPSNNWTIVTNETSTTLMMYSSATNFCSIPAVEVKGNNNNIYFGDLVSLDQFGSGTDAVAPIHVPEGTSVNLIGDRTIGSGLSLTKCEGNSACIGGNKGENAGNITFSGMTINISENDKCTAATIGGGKDGNGGNVILHDTVLSITSSSKGAVIGGGQNGNGGNVLIDGGNINIWDYSIDDESSVIGKGDGGVDDGTLTLTSGKLNFAEIPDYYGVKESDFVGGPIYLSDGEEDGKIWIQSGSENGIGMYLEFDRMDTSILGIRGLNVSTVEGANHAINSVKGALAAISSNRSKIGAQQNRLEHTVNNNNNVVENTQAAESLIRDADMAKEVVQNSTLDILSQAGISMMAQANQSRQGVLSLLQ